MTLDAWLRLLGDTPEIQRLVVMDLWAHRRADGMDDEDARMVQAAAVQLGVSLTVTRPLYRKSWSVHPHRSESG